MCRAVFLKYLMFLHVECINFQLFMISVDSTIVTQLPCVGFSSLIVTSREWKHAPFPPCVHWMFVLYNLKTKHFHAMVRSTPRGHSLHMKHRNHYCQPPPSLPIVLSMAPKSSKKAMMATDTTYGMSMDVPKIAGKGRRHRRGSSSRSAGNDDEDPSDGSASLTYSAGSSIASSAAGESTDSSFADIMRVLDVQDSQELQAIMKREGVTDPAQYHRNKAKASNVSVASSLNYSTDGESALDGVHLLQTITGYVECVGECL